MRYLIGDTETTGLGPARRACEVALLEIDENLEVVGEASSLINPECPIQPGAQDIHGISDEMVADCPTLEQWIEQTFGGKLDGYVCLIGYRVSFDKPMLAPIFENLSTCFDVLPLAQECIPEAPNHKLQTLKELLGLPGGPAHRAAGDVLTTHQLLQHLLPKCGRTLEQLCDTTFRMVHRMPWGKEHAGKLLIDVPVGYRNWMLTLADLDPNLRQSLELIRATDLNLNLKLTKAPL